MAIRIDNPTPDQIEDLIHFHETGADFYERQADSAAHSLAKWSRAQAAAWRGKMEVPQPASVRQLRDGKKLAGGPDA